MSGNELASDQPEVFEFSEENQKLIEGIIAKYHVHRLDVCF